MSFRSRLTLFFIIIVIVPMVAVALLLFGLISRSENGQVDAGNAAKAQTAGNLFKREQDAAGAKIEARVVRDRVFGDSLQRGDLRRARKRAGQLVASPRGIRRLVVYDHGRILVDVGDPKAVGAAVRDVASKSRQALFSYQVSVITASTYAARVQQLTGQNVVVRRAGAVLASTLPGITEAKPPSNGDELSVGHKSYQPRSFASRDFAGRNTVVTLLAPAGAAASSITNERLLAGGILLGFFLAAIACAVLVSKALQQQILGLLGAARRLGSGDFSAKAPTVGHDEFAALGEEFNKMSVELAARLEDLRTERRRVEGSMRRLGEAVASNLDREALLKLVVRTAVDGVGADAGRVSVRGPNEVALEELSRVGNMNGLEFAVQSVEAEALSCGAPRETTIGASSAIAHPLHARDGAGGIVGVVSIGRSGRPFTPEDRELFHYLAGQAGVSMENVGLHEAVARKSVTDDLTGLQNRRGFEDALSMEMERSRRFGTKLALVLLDLDDFKAINDTYGHQQGDVVLREVAHVLRETAREIDYPARYGGEEMAVLLPETDLDGAERFAERLRERIAELPVHRQDSSATLHVTTSCGVAAVPDSAVDGVGLVAAADAALYEAKREGKNKTVRAR